MGDFRRYDMGGFAKIVMLLCPGDVSYIFLKGKRLIA